jgi:hypothetical protein
METNSSRRPSLYLVACLALVLPSMAAPAVAQELVPVSAGLGEVQSTGSATAEELAESGKGKKVVKKVVKAAKAAKAVSMHPVVRAVTFPLTVDTYARAAWDAGRLTSKYDPGPYPGLKSAVLPSIKKLGR